MSPVREIFSKEILNLKEHPNCITGSRVREIFLNGWILPIGGALALEGLRSMGLPRLVFFYRSIISLIGTTCSKADKMYIRLAPLMAIRFIAFIVCVKFLLFEAHSSSSMRFSNCFLFVHKLFAHTYKAYETEYVLLSCI